MPTTGRVSHDPPLFACYNAGMSFETPENRSEKEPGPERVVVYLGARMHETNATDADGNKKWAFPLFTQDQANTGTPLPGEVSGGFSRQEAIRKLQHEAQEAGERMLVLVTGGNERTGVVRDDAAAQRLVSEEGIPVETVVPIDGAGSTRGNALAALRYFEEHPETLKRTSGLEIVTNDFHMLRAWIMFSSVFLEHATGEQLSVSHEDQERIFAILEEGTPKEREPFDPQSVHITRDRVMEILSKYFENSSVRIIPKVAEEVLEDGNEAEARYARMLKNNEWAIKTLVYEYQGVRQLLLGTYTHA